LHEDSRSIKRPRFNRFKPDPTTPSLLAPAANCSPSNFWHNTFIHASSSRLFYLPYVKNGFNSVQCISCIRVKQAKKPYKRVNKPSTARRRQLFHSDICDPFSNVDNGDKYLLTFLDDWSHYVWAKTLPDKSSKSVNEAFTSVIKELQTAKINVESLRTDNGREYEKELISVLQSLGVKHQTTAPYTSQSNGKAERLNRTLEEAVRAMLFYANMPEKFWADAMVTATYVSNFLPSKTIDNEIP